MDGLGVEPIEVVPQVFQIAGKGHFLGVTHGSGGEGESGNGLGPDLEGDDFGHRGNSVFHLDLGERRDEGGRGENLATQGAHRGAVEVGASVGDAPVDLGVAAQTHEGQAAADTDGVGGRTFLDVVLGVHHQVQPFDRSSGGGRGEGRGTHGLAADQKGSGGQERK